MSQIFQRTPQTPAARMIAGVLLVAVLLLAWNLFSPSKCAEAAAECPGGSTSVFSQDVGIQGGSAFTITVTGVPTEARTWTLQDATDTFVGRATTDTLTNKSIIATQVTAGTFAAGTFSFSGSTLTTLGTVNGGTINAGLTWSAA